MDELVCCPKSTLVCLNTELVLIHHGFNLVEDDHHQRLNYVSVGLSIFQDECVWTCGVCRKQFRDVSAVKKHRELCQANNDKSFFSCHICEIEYETLHHLNAHYAQHYKDQLKERVTNALPGQLPFT